MSRVQQNTGENRKKQQEIFQSVSEWLSLVFYAVCTAMGYFVRRLLEGFLLRGWLNQPFFLNVINVHLEEEPKLQGASCMFQAAHSLTRQNGMSHPQSGHQGNMVAGSSRC